MICINHHGATKAFSADPEFCKKSLIAFLKKHKSEVCSLRSRSSHKNGKIEQINGLFKLKLVLEKLAQENCADSAHILVSRASLFTNMQHGSTVLSSFQMVRGYGPSIIGRPTKVVLDKQFEAQIQLTAHRELMKALSSRVPCLLTEGELPAGRHIWVQYNTYKKNERPRRILATVEMAEMHIVHCCR